VIYVERFLKAHSLQDSFANICADTSAVLTSLPSAVKHAADLPSTANVRAVAGREERLGSNAVRLHCSSAGLISQDVEAL